MRKEQIEQLREEIIDALHDSMDVDDNSVDMRLFEINLTSVLEWTFNTEECYHKGKYTYSKETFECHKCGLIVPNEYRFNTK